MITSIRLLSAGILVGLLAGILSAGPLAPPSGPAASTYKTLAEVQPRTPVQSLPGSPEALYIITQPGSYYLTGNIAVTTANVSAIRVRASDVTIDLCGFTIDGGGLGLAAIDESWFSAGGLAVRNGSLTNWQHAGIDAVYVSGCLFDSLRVRNGGEVGLHAGPGSVIRNCTTHGGDSGIAAGPGTHVVDCAATSGFVGISVAWGSSLARSAVSNCSFGIGVVGEDCSITDCTVRGGLIGIDLDGARHRVERCKIGQVTDGIRAFFTCTLVNNSVSAAAAGQGSGIIGYQECRIDGNHIYAFDNGIRSYGQANVVTANTMHSCTHPIAGTISAMVAPVVTTAAALAANPTANIAQ